MAKNKRFTEKDLINILNNKNVAIANPVSNPKIVLKAIKPINVEKIPLISIDKETENNTKSGKKQKSHIIPEINLANQQALIKYTVSDVHLSLVFDGAKLLSLNQMFNFLQNQGLKHNLFTYKKVWHNLIKDILFQIHCELRNNNKELPYFNSSVELTIFRQAPRLVDEDALTTMFKYIIDALKKTEDNPYGVLAEDNPKIVHKISSYSEKGSYGVGIKVKLIKERKEAFTMDKILEP